MGKLFLILLTCLPNSNAPWTDTSNSPLSSSTSPFSPSLSLRRPTPPCSQKSSVNPSNMLGMVSSVPVPGLDTPWPPLTSSVLSSDTLICSANTPDMPPKPLASSPNSPNSEPSEQLLMLDKASLGQSFC